MLKAILIDIDNTLLDFHKNSAYAMEKSFELNGIGYKQEYFSVFTIINNGLWEQVEDGKITREQLWKKRFNMVLTALNLDSSNFEKVESDFKKFLFDSALEVDGAQELLKYLYNKYEIYACSNAIYNQQINRLKKADMLKYFKNVFVSEKIGYQKPTTEFFDECFKEMNGLQREECILIGDSLTADIRGGLNYHLKTIWYNHDKKKDNPNIKPDYKVDKLIEIENII